MPLSAQHSSLTTDWLFKPSTKSDLFQSIDAIKALIDEFCCEYKPPFSGTSKQAIYKTIRQTPIKTGDMDEYGLLYTLKKIYLDHLIHFNNPLYAAHLNCPISNTAIAVELLATAFNTAVESWDQSTGATLIEQQMIDWASDLCGLSNRADGVFTTGGTQSNLMGLMMARDYYCERQLNGHNCKTQGLPAEAKDFVVFCSELSHFSIEKAAALCGLGYESVIKLKTQHFKIVPEVLELEIAKARIQGKIPIGIFATAGTTDFGSIDPLESMADIAQRNNLWLHVDSAYGCGLLASTSNRYKLSGIEQADSITLDFHKSFYQPVACSAFLAAEGNHFKYITYHADYLNPVRHHHDATPNAVNKSLQTTRRFDALKLYATIQLVGLESIGHAFDTVCDLSRKAAQLISCNPYFEVLATGDLSTVVFRYLPLDYQERTNDFLNELNYQLRERLIEEGKVMIAATKYNGLQFLKCTFLNPDTTLEHLEMIIKACDQMGEIIYESMVSFEKTTQEAVA